MAHRLPAIPGPQSRICSNHLNGTGAESTLLLRGERSPSPLLFPFLSFLSPALALLQLSCLLDSAELIQFANLAEAVQGFYLVFCWFMELKEFTEESGECRANARGEERSTLPGTAAAFQQHRAIPAAPAVTQTFIPSHFMLTVFMPCQAPFDIKRSLGAKPENH